MRPKDDSSAPSPDEEKANKVGNGVGGLVGTSWNAKLGRT
jgi:hypothetical protein